MLAHTDLRKTSIDKYKWLRGGKDAPGAVVEANGVQKADEFYFKIYFGGGKGATLEIWQA